MFGKVKPPSSMKSEYVSASPDQATPMIETDSLHCCDASSTEGASRIHVAQYGAQNHSTTALLEYPARLSSPPPTSGAVQSYAAGIDGASGLLLSVAAWEVEGDVAGDTVETIEGVEPSVTVVCSSIAQAELNIASKPESAITRGDLISHENVPEDLKTGHLCVACTA